MKLRMLGELVTEIFLTFPREADGPFSASPTSRMQSACEKRDKNSLKKLLQEGKKILPGRESNPGFPRDRRRYLPLYYRGLLATVCSKYCYIHRDLPV